MGEKVRYVRNARRHETNKDVPIITQKNLGPKEFRELRKFLKTASSEELREWLLRLKEANEDYTQRKFLENSKELVQAKKDAENRLKDFREVAKPLIDYSRKSFFYRLTHKPPLV